MDENEVFFEVNLTGVAPQGTFVALRSGVYKGEVIAMKKVAHKSEAGAHNIEITMRTTEPGWEGAERRLWLRVPDATEKGENARKQWRTAMESVGYTSAQLDSGNNIGIRPKNFVGKEGHFEVKAGDPNDRESFDDVRFIVPSKYATEKKNAKSRAENPNIQGPTGQGGQGSTDTTTTTTTESKPAESLDPSAIKASLLD